MIRIVVLSVTILETTKTLSGFPVEPFQFYRSQYWRLQKLYVLVATSVRCFIGHNFGDYKNLFKSFHHLDKVLSVTILETTKTNTIAIGYSKTFYRSQFWRLQKPQIVSASYTIKVRIYSA